MAHQCWVLRSACPAAASIFCLALGKQLCPSSAPALELRRAGDGPGQAGGDTQAVILSSPPPIFLSGISFPNWLTAQAEIWHGAIRTEGPHLWPGEAAREQPRCPHCVGHRLDSGGSKEKLNYRIISASSPPAIYSSAEQTGSL